MPNSAAEMTQRYLDLWKTRGVRAWHEEWWELSRHVGNKIAKLMNAKEDTVSIQPNVTLASATALSCFEFNTRRNKVVMVEMEFPSLLYLYQSWMQGEGRVEIVPCPDGITIPLAKILAAIDDTTLLVPISHVLFRSAYIVDIHAIVERAHKVGAMVVVDIFQSLGTVPVEVGTLNVDFAVGGCLKWLCGGPGACFLYVRPDLVEKLNPRLTGWFAHRRPFAFETNPIEFNSGSYKFLNGTPAIPALYTCQAGIDIVTKIGVDEIRRHSLELTTRLLNAASARGWATKTPQNPTERGGTVTVDIPNAREISEELKVREFIVDYRANAGIRISPHFYNTTQEIDETVSEIEKIIADESYLRHSGKKTIVT
jgi:kynureninase